LTFDRKFVTAYGYTQAELEANFAPFLAEFMAENEGYTMESLLIEIKEWYNGYSWDAKTSVYNPFGILYFFKNMRFLNSWFSSGTPTFLTKKIMHTQDFDMENHGMNLDELDISNIDAISILALMFQSGYLTMSSLDIYNNVTLSFPNREVRESFFRFLILDLSRARGKISAPITDLSKALQKNDIETAERLVQHVFTDLPYDVYTNQSERQVEGFYHGIIHILFQYLGIYIQSEVHTTRGRADSVVFANDYIFIFEFKINKTADEALQQIKDKNYASKYENTTKQIVLIGANFDTKEREMNDWAVEIVA
jgi:PD-(D/E)XK nuclease superfamily/Predicted AAA-ATPase